MLVFCFPLLKISAVTYTIACARIRFCFWKASAQRFFRWEVVRHARACSRRCACLPACARGRPRRLGCSLGLGGSAAKWTNVVWPIKSRQTNQQTNTHYSFIGIYIYIYIYIYFCPPPRYLPRFSPDIWGVAHSPKLEGPSSCLKIEEGGP